MPWHRSSNPGQRPGFIASADGLRFQVQPSHDATFAPATRYLAQLQNEGLAVGKGENLLIPWESLYQVLSDEDHSGGLQTLDLPNVGDWRPILASNGSPSDGGFAIWIDGWMTGAGSARDPDVIGGLAQSGKQRWLLDEATWQLSREVAQFQERSPGMDPVERMHAVGRIQKAARACGAAMDDYLSRTPVLSPDRLDLNFVLGEVLGEPVVEIKPGFEGAPSKFVEAFDRYNDVRGRYDLPTEEGGLVHLAPSPKVREVLETLKAIPGRRVASDRARLLIHNPHLVLGESASEAIDEDQLLRAKLESRLVSYRLELRETASGQSDLLFVPDSPEGQPESLPLEPELARKLLASAHRSQAKSLPLFTIDGREVELNAVTQATLEAISNWLSQLDLAKAAEQFGEFLRLDDYSDRVIGFDEAKPQAVPYVARRDGEQGWVPENTERGVFATDPATGEPRRIVFDEQGLEELKRRVATARAAKAETVQLPGIENVSLPIQQAERLLEGGSQAKEIGLGKSPGPRPVDKPKPAGKKATLRILHNLDSLDYGQPIALANPAHSEQPTLPRALREEIRLLPHQAYGLAWLQTRLQQREEQVEGCLLADDMGLGKTLQSLSLIAWYHETQSPALPCLVVAPVSLLQNWKAEVVKFLHWDERDVLALYGEGLSPYRTRPAEIPDAIREMGVQKLLRQGFESGHKLVLTTYETLRDYEISLAKVHWGIVVCDEAQKIKNPATYVTQAAKALRADFRIACTGTPVENSLADLWCLFDFFQPGSLGSLAEFTRNFRESIETRSEGYEQLVEALRAAIGPWVLRRLKSEVTKDLPKKIDSEHPEADVASQRLRMGTEQAQLYDKAVAEYRRARESSDRRERSQILPLLAKLRMICAHPAMQLHSDHETLPMKQHLALSPKLAWVMDRLLRIRPSGDKVIVFSEFRDIQRLLQRAVQEVFGLDAQIINGSTSVDAEYDQSRQRIIDRFQAQEGFGVLILSTTAVGFGVNIQAANHVIHFTRPWNPAKEDQATDRAYRIGQKKDVYVYCPIVVGNGFESFEERLDALLTSKRALSRDMLAGAQELSAEDFAGL